MNTLEHLSKILPSNGLKVMATMVQRTDAEGNLIFKNDGKPSITTKHKTFGSIEQLAKTIQLNARSGRPIYMAMGGFDRERSFIDKEYEGKQYKGFSRSADFTTHFRSFWLDLDVGEDKAINGDGYATQEIAIEKLWQFVNDLGLPDPMVVNSGRGVHAYWPLNADLDAASWWKLAKVFDAIIKHYGLLADPACTADKARILRPIGTINHKNGHKVELISDANSISYIDFANALKPYYKAHKEEIEAVKIKTTEYVKKDRSEFKDDKPKHVKYFLKRCQVGKYVLNGEEAVAEPVWRGVLGVMRYCENADKHIETLRKKCKDRFPDTTRFDEDRTAEKLQRLESMDVGPTTCGYFNRECGNLCDGCPYLYDETVKTPLRLAEHYEEIEIPQYNLEIGALEYPVQAQSASDGERGDEIANASGTTSSEPNSNDSGDGGDNQTSNSTTPQPPFPYRRTAKGLVVTENDVEKVFFKGDLFPIMTKFVEVIDGEQNIMVKYQLRVGLSGKYQEVSFPMKDWYATDRLKQRLGSAGVSISEKNMATLIMYLRAYQNEVQEMMDEVRQLQHFGWDGNKPQFLLGSRLYRPDGVVTVQPHANIKNYCGYFDQAGTLEGWKELMRRLGSINAVEQQICLLSSLGSSLMRFTNYNGIWLHLMTKPGYGKTTTQEMMNGVWGNPSDLLLNAKDTVNAIEERFGRLTNVAVTIDELSNLDPRATSDLLLGVTQGRTKRRLDSNMRERVDNLSWQLMVLSSGNFSLIDRINTAKEDVAAEISRTLEFKLPKPTLSVHEGELLIKKPIRENYGVAGAEWLRNLVRIPQTQIQEMIDRTTETFSTTLEATSEERFWVTGCSVIYVAGVLANKMGLVEWDMKAVFDKLCEIVKSNRNNKDTYEFSPTDILAGFLAENTRNTVVTDKGTTEGSIMIRLFPQGALNVRYEQDTGNVLIRTGALKEFLAKRGVGINSVREALNQRGLLLESSARRVLSQGLPQNSGRSYCWVIKADDLVKSTLDQIVEDNNE